MQPALPTYIPRVTGYQAARKLPTPVQHPYLGPLDRYIELTGTGLRPSFWFEPMGEWTGYMRLRGIQYPFVRRETDGSSVLVGVPAHQRDALVVTDQLPLSFDWYNPDNDTLNTYVVGATDLCGAMECVLAAAKARPGARLRRARPRPVARSARFARAVSGYSAGAT